MKVEEREREIECMQYERGLEIETETKIFGYLIKQLFESAENEASS